jgi:hydrogenase 3 maturation protease
MSTNSWLEKLQQVLTRLQLRDPFPRVAIVGIGHPLRGDDAVGPYMIRKFGSSFREDETLLMVDAGPAPENCTGILKRFMPDLVILIDATEMEGAPGSIQSIHWQDSIGLSASTHSLPLHVFIHYLTRELGCEMMLLGIQPLDTSMDAALSSAVREAAESAVLEITAMLSSTLGIDAVSQDQGPNDFRIPNIQTGREFYQEQIRP